ncbi:hypothetical protein [Acidithiobacillus sp. AMEEHan]|uniref:hypothetical protein n=1 Tax=Acidithiobacillus sp. AMEEHan TaxID=2994951 RepID=UPI0027E4934F|nr:hypothetical protein [Acidithiobacillus sp. AMEEHan]
MDNITNRARELGKHPDQDNYASFFPYYAEFSALSEFRKKPGVGIELSSGIGGHSVLYLNGVKVDRTANGYPLLQVCGEDESPATVGAGISVNEHYRNANWIAIEGRDFFMRGTLGVGEPLTHENYLHTQEQAKAFGILDGIEFHSQFLNNKPRGMSTQDYMYELSIATDFAVRFGRDAYCARVPLDREQMEAVVNYLNMLNHPYREGSKQYTWKLFNDNCVHVAHNALAQAGIWPAWPTGQWAVRAAFRFPVPKNTFVDLVLRTNDLPLTDAKSLLTDANVRSSLLRWGSLPTKPGALTIFEPAILPNDIYDVYRNLKLIFYDNPFWGPYRFHLKRIFKSLRYTQLRDNLTHFVDIYSRAQYFQKHIEEDLRECYNAHIIRFRGEASRILRYLEEAT